MAAKKAAKKAPPRKIVEKKTGERYKSRAAMRKHEKSEGAAERRREYGSAKKRGR